MTKQNDEPCATSIPPADLSPELSERFLSAMKATSAEVVEEELERRLRRLQPAPIGAGRHRMWAEKMGKVASSLRYKRSGRYALHRWGAAAVLFLCCTSGGVLMMNNRASATVVSGFACRSVIDSRTGEAVQWQEGQTALRSCEVLYEDSFVFDGDEESTITVRVPVRTQVMIEEEVI